MERIHPFDEILERLTGTTGAKKEQVVVGETVCEVFATSEKTWNVYIDGFCVTIT